MSFFLRKTFKRVAIQYVRLLLTVLPSRAAAAKPTIKSNDNEYGSKCPVGYADFRILLHLVWSIISMV